MIGIALQPRAALTGRDAIWAAIRNRGRFTILDLEHDTRLKTAAIRDYVSGLAAAGYLKLLPNYREANGRLPRGCWVLMNDVGVEPPRVTRDGREVTRGRVHEQLWRTMKMLPEFDKRDLAVHASTAEHPVTVAEAGRYSVFLYKARYLALVAPSRPHHPARYRLLRSRNSGPRPPQIERKGNGSRWVFDPNTGTRVYAVGGAA